MCSVALAGDLFCDDASLICALQSSWPAGMLTRPDHADCDADLATALRLFVAALRFCSTEDRARSRQEEAGSIAWE